MQEEINSIHKNLTWDLTELPKDHRAIVLKWVYKTKLNSDGSVYKRKARLVAKGYFQRQGIDFEETFAPVARMEIVRTFLAVAAQRRWPVYQLDVKSAFPNGELQEIVYVEQPEGFIKEGHEQLVYRLRKALYWLRQAPRAWYSKIDEYFIHQGFQKSENEPTLYKKIQGKLEMLLVCLYVDDIIYMGSSL